MKRALGVVLALAIVFGNTAYASAKAPQVRVLGEDTTIWTVVSHTVGLRTDGTVVAVGGNPEGQLNVSGWRDIVAVSAGGHHTIGLRKDGRVIATPIIGQHADTQHLYDVSGWRDIIAVSAGTFSTVGLKADGRVEVVGVLLDIAAINDWRDITAVSAGTWHVVGLRADGTVVATRVVANEIEQPMSNVGDWRDIVAVSAGVSHTVGLRADGTVVAVGDNSEGQLDVSGWSGIVAVSAGMFHTVGLRANGTVVSTRITDSRLDYGQSNVLDWHDIVAVSAGQEHTVGMRSDGTAVSVGSSSLGSIDVTGWRDIKVPSTINTTDSVTRITNPGSFTLAQLRAHQTIINADSLTADDGVDVRIILNPDNAATSLNLSASTTSANAVSTQKIFQDQFGGTFSVISLGQQGDFGMEVTIVARVSSAHADNLFFYSFNREANTFRRFTPRLCTDGQQRLFTLYHPFRGGYNHQQRAAGAKVEKECLKISSELLIIRLTT